MKRIIPIGLAILCSTLFASAQSKKENFDFGWKFCESDVPDASAISFNDAGWQEVVLPHDWDIYHAPALDGATGNDGGYYPGGIGWYRKTLQLTTLPTDPAVSQWLHFEGVYQNCQIFVNGTKVTTHAYGYTPFKVDISKYIHEGSNTVAVRVDNSQQPNCRWYSGSGIYRHVWLETYDARKMDDPQQLFVYTERVYGINAEGTHADSAAVRVTYADKLNEIRMLRDVDLWAPAHPKLYDLTVGELTVKHGVRTFSYDATKGFVLNGQPMLINGACMHHDDGVLGAMAYDAAEIRKVRLMKEAGFNLIRTSHNPQTRAMLDACDSLGMLVVDEAFDGWYTQKTKYDYHMVIDSCYRQDLAAMVLRDRNHPSIISWSIGNEVIERKEIRVVQTAQKFKDVILSLDRTRPVTEALCAWDSDWEIFDPHAAVLDIVGYNYMMHKAESDHSRLPERVMWQTESYPRHAFGNWKHTLERSYIIGDMVWTGLDYLGESGIGQFHYDGEFRGEHYQAKQFPYHGAYCGDVDITGWRKPISHYRDMLWNKSESDPFVYMAVREPDKYYNGRVSETSWSVWPTWESWNWKGWEGQKIEAEIYTKLPKVCLYLNDKLIETRDVNLATEYKAIISLPYEPGVLKAVALDAQGNPVAESMLRTSQAPESVRLSSDRVRISTDGQDLAYITLEVVDGKGNLVPDASVPLLVNVSGQGELMAAASASFKDLEPKTSTRVTTYKGRAIAVVRGLRKAGKINVVVSSPELKKSNRLTLSVK